ncbi:hypothetical protein HDV05_004333 [Chytridiales sp. JEL 0842]|nr:hypothetical protein HDV05_004333 [Chytridiales sp. JEL 0842]
MDDQAIAAVDPSLIVSIKHRVDEAPVVTEDIPRTDANKASIDYGDGDEMVVHSAVHGKPVGDNIKGPIGQDDSTSSRVGPDQKLRLQTYSIWSTIVSLFGCLWVMVGVVFICTVLIAATVNIGYGAINSAQTLSSFLLAAGLSFGIMIAYTFFRSLIRTASRIMMFFWNSKYGEDGHSDTFPLIHFRKSVRLLASKLPRKETKRKGGEANGDGERGGIHITVPMQALEAIEAYYPLLVKKLREFMFDLLGEEEEEVVARRLDSIGTMVFFAIVTIPIILIVGLLVMFLPFWNLVAVISIGFSASSVITILLLNLGTRLYRTYKTLSHLYNLDSDLTTPQRLMHSYAFAGFDLEVDIFTCLGYKGLMGAVIALIFSVLFVAAKESIVMPFVATVICFLFLIFYSGILGRWLRPLCRDTFFDVSNRDHYALYTGVKAWPAVDAVLLRTLTWALGFASLIYYDLRWHSKENPLMPQKPLNISAGLTILYVLLIIFLDILWLLPSGYLSPKPRVIITTITMSLLLALTITCRILYESFTATATLLLTPMLLTYRQPRFLWGPSGNPNYAEEFVQWHYGPQARLRKRTSRRMKFTVVGAVLGGFVGVVIGFALDTGRAEQTVQAALNAFASSSASTNLGGLGSANGGLGLDALRRIYTPTLCQLNVTSFVPLTLFDVAPLAKASYQSNKTDAESLVKSFNRTSLAGWKAVNGTLENPGAGVRWVEFRWGNDSGLISEVRDRVSVVSVRGTYSVNDIFQDMYLFGTSALLQLSSYLGTAVTLWPSESVSKLNYIISTFGPESASLLYWIEVENHVSHLLAQNRSVFLTGHSLGGAVANIVAAHLEVPAATLSSPGLGYSTFRCNVSFL